MGEAVKSIAARISGRVSEAEIIYRGGQGGNTTSSIALSSLKSGW